MSDEDLQKLTTITLVDYDPRWPELFEREANRVCSALGNKALRVEHVGSTSVPGLCAKPIIDMLLVVADSADELSYLPDLEAAGYILQVREPEWFEHRLFKGPDTATGITMPASNGTWLSVSGGTCSTTRRLKLRLSRRSWSERTQPSRSFNIICPVIGLLNWWLS